MRNYVEQTVPGNAPSQYSSDTIGHCFHQFASHFVISRLGKQWIHAGDSVEIVGLLREIRPLPVQDKGSPRRKVFWGEGDTKAVTKNSVHVWFSLTRIHFVKPCDAKWLQTDIIHVLQSGYRPTSRHLFSELNALLQLPMLIIRKNVRVTDTALANWGIIRNWLPVDTASVIGN